MNQPSEWRAIEEEAPPLGERVLCWVECLKCRSGEDHAHRADCRGYPNHGAYIDKQIVWDGDLRWTCWSPNTTHWMPLPGAPNE